MKETKRFEDVTLHDQYPQQDVAEHEVFMSFKNNDDAGFFHEWWTDEGSYLFKTWLGERPVEEV